MRKTAAEAAETRQAILRAALDEFSQRGYSATTLDGVARAAGVTRGAVYWHFASKAALYEELLSAFGGQAGAIMGAAVAEGGDFIVVCQRILTHLLTRLEEDKELRAVMNLSLFKARHTGTCHCCRQSAPARTVGRATRRSCRRASPRVRYESISIPGT